MAARTEPRREGLPDLMFTRTFDAPRELVFKVWTDPRHLAQWWGPHDHTNPACTVDLRPGGAVRITMRGPDGTEYPVGGIFSEIVPPERLVFTSDLEDANGKALIRVVNTVTFTEQGGKTRMTLRAAVIEVDPKAEPNLAGMEAGWTQSLERLAAEVARLAA